MHREEIYERIKAEEGQGQAVNKDDQDEEDEEQIGNKAEA